MTTKVDDIESFLQKKWEQGLSSPGGIRWADFHQMLAACGSENDQPLAPLILAAAFEPDSEKRLRLEEQLHWASEHNCLEEAIRFLEKIPLEKWDSVTEGANRPARTGDFDEIDEAPSSDDPHEDLYLKADIAGKHAAAIYRLDPMQGGRGISNDSVPGIACINISPAPRSFAEWLLANDLAIENSDAGGLMIWVSDYDQSMELKYAYAVAFAEVLTKAGYTCRVEKRIAQAGPS